ncbi:lytic transglycosylase domain-containing protein [Trinickia caryophylli]|nr:lytic transglycosylase domain-containing protein [Trinickia caryophylli]PMS12093.1 lytic transglycosylase [Trinickia caryophylli]TRX18601.1 lytic transglycosylase domain-containing protein [Trinickia caryophylli]
MSRLLCSLLISFGLLTYAVAEENDAMGAHAGSAAIAASAASVSTAAASPIAASDIAGERGAAPAQRHRISALLVEKFGLARAKAEEISTAVMTSASKYSLPPALVLAIISIESRFHEKARGANGATGLMQVVPGAHRGLVRNVDLTEPSANIEVGSAILRGYLESARGNVAAALKSYGGSSAYARKVSVHAREFELGVGASDVVVTH